MNYFFELHEDGPVFTSGPSKPQPDPPRRHIRSREPGRRFHPPRVLQGMRRVKRRRPYRTGYTDARAASVSAANAHAYRATVDTAAVPKRAGQPYRPPAVLIEWSWSWTRPLITTGGNP